MRVVGVDPGLNVTGYGVVLRQGKRMTLLEAGVIRPGGPQHPLEQRLSTLYDGLSEVLAQYRPDVLSLEEVFSHQRFPGSALWMAHARGVVCLAAARSGVPIYSYAPASVKSALVGNGRATKPQVQHMVAQRLGLAAPPSPADVADALAIAITHLDATGGLAELIEGTLAPSSHTANGPRSSSLSRSPVASSGVIES